MPVLPRVMVSAALNLRERGGGAKERRAKAALRNQAATDGGAGGAMDEFAAFHGASFWGPWRWLVHYMDVRE